MSDQSVKDDSTIESTTDVIKPDNIDFIKDLGTKYEFSGTDVLLQMSSDDLQRLCNILTNKGDFEIKPGNESKVVMLGFYYVLNGPIGLSKIIDIEYIGSNLKARDLFLSVNRSGFNHFLFSIKDHLTRAHITVNCKMLRDFGEYYPNDKFQQSDHN